MGIAEESTLQRATFLHGLSQRLSRNNQAFTLNLDEGFVRRPTIAKDHAMPVMPSRPTTQLQLAVGVGGDAEAVIYRK
jgi:hypothetical protein